MPSKTPKQTPNKFAPGDRVAERPKASFIPNLKPETVKKITPYRTQRYGTVLETYIKKANPRSKKPINSKYVKVLWDGCATPSEHAQFRLISESELPQLLETYSEVLG
jgi:hypothetical protein